MLLSWENIASSLPQTFPGFSNHAVRPKWIKFSIAGAVCTDSSHTMRSDSRLLRNSVAEDEGQVKTCRRCSSLWLHIGHCDPSLAFLCTITLPVAVSPLSHLVKNILIEKEASLRAVLNDSQCTFTLAKLRGNSEC